METIRILAPGGYTTIQDRGRFGYQHMGVPVSGALDNVAFTLANLLVGNPENRAALELTVMGISLEIRKETDIALTGAAMGIKVNGIARDQWVSIRVKPGDHVFIGQVQSGCRGYLALGGGIRVPEVMGSFSTYVGGRVGGFQGRTLQKNDLLETWDAPLLVKERVIPREFIPVYAANVRARAIPGPQEEYFDEDALKTLFRSEYSVTTQADRMGYRLEGAAIPIKEGMPRSIISEPSIPGSIQIPPEGNPIILGVEQTVGGYAKIATIISSDFPIIAQTIPGNTIGFERIDLNTAHGLIIENQIKLKAIKKSFSRA